MSDYQECSSWYGPILLSSICISHDFLESVNFTKSVLLKIGFIRLFGSVWLIYFGGHSVHAFFYRFMNAQKEGNLGRAERSVAEKQVDILQHALKYHPESSEIICRLCQATQKFEDLDQTKARFEVRSWLTFWNRIRSDAPWLILMRVRSKEPIVISSIFYRLQFICEKIPQDQLQLTCPELFVKHHLGNINIATIFLLVSQTQKYNNTETYTCNLQHHNEIHYNGCRALKQCTKKWVLW